MHSYLTLSQADDDVKLFASLFGFRHVDWLNVQNTDRLSWGHLVIFDVVDEAKREAVDEFFIITLLIRYITNECNLSIST